MNNKMTDTKSPNRDVIAHHEAGHAVMRVRLSRPIKEVIIDDATDDSGKPVLGCVDPGVKESDEQRFDWCVDMGAVQIAMAGPAAQEIYTGERDDYNAGSDRLNAMAIIKQCSVSLNDDSPLVKRLVEAAYEECLAFFNKDTWRWRQVELVAEKLIQKGKLSGGEVKHIMSSANSQ